MISADELAKRIFELPTLPYYFESGGLKRYAYLGGGESEAAGRMCLNYVHKAAFLRLCALYADGVSEAARREISSVMKKLVNGCNSRLRGFFTESEQEQYIRSLSQTELEQISEQAQMYGFCLGVMKSRVKKRVEKQ